MKKLFMKKTLRFALVTSTVFLLTACNFGFNQETEEVKSLEPVEEVAETEEDLEVEETEETVETEGTTEVEESVETEKAAETEEVDETEAAVESEETEEIEELETYDGPNYIRLISYHSMGDIVSSTPVILQGAVSPNTEKIVVKWKAAQGGYEDVYTLKDFKKGDREFTYRANFAWNNLSHGYNDYTFVAYYDDGTEEKVHTTVNFKNDDSARENPVFDGCKNHITAYSDYSWFNDLSRNVYNTYGFGLYDKIDYVKQADACYSENGQMVIFLLNGEYRSKGQLFKYYINTGELFEADLINEQVSASTWMEFGKRNGSIIPLYGYFGDAGYQSEYLYDYDFKNNTVTYIKSRAGTIDGGYGDWVYAKN